MKRNIKPNKGTVAAMMSTSATVDELQQVDELLSDEFGVLSDKYTFTFTHVH